MMDYKRMEEDTVDGVSKTSPTSGGLPQPFLPVQQPTQTTVPAVPVQQTYTPQTPGPQVIIVKKETPPISKSKAKPLMILGLMQLVLGILMMIFNIAAITIWAFMSFVGAGIWVGIFVIITGAFGVVSSKTLGRGYIITFMILSIISSVFVWNVIGFAAGGLPEDAHGEWHYVGGNYNNGYRVVNESKIAMNSILLMLGFVETVVAIVASAICCSAMCCRSSSPSTSGQVQYLNHHPQTQYMVLQYQPGQNVQYVMPAAPGQQPQNLQFAVPQVGQTHQYAMPAAQHVPQQQPAMMSMPGATPPPMYQTLPPQPQQHKADH